MNNSTGIEPHQSCAGGIGSDRIVREHDLAERTSSAVERSIAFHRYYPVRDHEMDRNGGTQIENALLNALPVENILRPSVSCARYYAEHVLHAKSNAGPVVGLDLRHGNQEIRFQHSPGEPEVPHAGIARA